MEFYIVYLFLSFFSVANAETINACESKTAALDCGNKLINIQNANFGRQSTTICADTVPATQVQNTTCISSNSLTLVTEACQGKNTCNVLSNTVVFRDPCPGVYKYLSISFECVANAETINACESKTAALDCGNKLINIQNANFGRQNTTICADTVPATQVQNTTCISSNSLTLVKEACQGKNTCNVSSNRAVFGDPCPGVYKYLNISYECIDESVTSISTSSCTTESNATHSTAITESTTSSTTAYPPNAVTRRLCYLDKLKIVCPIGQTVNVVNVFYGRTNQSICPSKPNEAHAICDGSAEANLKIHRLCDGKNNCNVDAHDGVLGHTCHHSKVRPYLEIVYICQ